jgi:hypothetical protein
MQTIMRISAVVLAVAGVASPAAGWAQDTGAQPVLEVGVRTMNAEGSRGRDAGVSRMLQPGQVATTLLHAGRIENPEGQLCSMRAADTTGRELNELDKRGLANALYVWKITMRGITAEPGRQTLDLEWQRFDRGSTAAAHSSKMRLTLADGQTHALDLVHGAAAPPCNTRAVILELKASTREDPALADTVRLQGRDASLGGRARTGDARRAGLDRAPDSSVRPGGTPRLAVKRRPALGRWPEGSDGGIGRGDRDPAAAGRRFQQHVRQREERDGGQRAA